MRTTSIIALLLLSNCGAGGQYLMIHRIVFAKDGADAAEKRRDWFECQDANRNATTGTTTIIEEPAAKQCMADRGYTWTDRGI